MYLKYLGIPYSHRGRNFAGADCFGLLLLFYQYEMQIELPDFTEEYTEEWWKEHDYFGELYPAWGFSEVEHPKTGDLIFFKNCAARAGHVGVVLDESNFIHMSKSGVQIANYRYGVWPRQISGYVRYTKGTSC